MTELIPLGSLPGFHALRDPGRPILTHRGETLSRSEFEARANRRARALQRLGVVFGDRVLMLLPNGIEFFETTFALWKLGATPVPAPPELPDRDVVAYRELVQARVIIGARAPGGGIIEIPADLAIDPLLGPEALAACVAPHWRISMSGGSTGRPKVIIDRTPAVVDPLAAMLHQQVDGVHLNPGPLYHSEPFGLSHRGLFVGSHLVNMDRFDPMECLRLIERHRVDWVYLVPTMMHRIWRLPEEERVRVDLSSLRAVFHMASICPPWLKENWIQWLGPDRIWELYSNAENPGRTVIGGAEWLTHRGSVGRVQPGSELAIFDEEGRRCAIREVGEVCFKTDGGQQTFQYLGADPRLIDGFVSLGDLGYLDEDGYLYIVDRRTDLIVSGGVNVYPAEVEGALESHPDVQCAVVIGLPDADLGHRVHAIVQVCSGAAVTSDALRAYLAPSLLRYKIPRSFEFSDVPLRDNAGKVRRSALREQRMNDVRLSQCQ